MTFLFSFLSSFVYLFVFVQNLYIINIDDVAASVMSKQLQRVREGQSFVIIISIYIYSFGITDHGIYFILSSLLYTKTTLSVSFHNFDRYVDSHTLYQHEPTRARHTCPFLQAGVFVLSYLVQ